MEVKMLDMNASYKDKCLWYQAVNAELITKSGKKDSVRLSLMKIKKNGKLDRKDFSHYFNVGLQDMVKDYIACGVTSKGITDEKLKAALEDNVANVDDASELFVWYGFWHNQEFGGTYKHKESGKIASSQLVFIPCDEDTSIPKRIWAMDNTRLQTILQNYTKVSGPAEEEDATGTDAESEEEEKARLQREYEEFMASRRK